jgi:hypothetical protein
MLLKVSLRTPPEAAAEMTLKLICCNSVEEKSPLAEPPITVVDGPAHFTKLLGT